MNEELGQNGGKNPPGIQSSREKRPKVVERSEHGEAGETQGPDPSDFRTTG